VVGGLGVGRFELVDFQGHANAVRRPKLEDGVVCVLPNKSTAARAFISASLLDLPRWWWESSHVRAPQTYRFARGHKAELKTAMGLMGGGPQPENRVTVSAREVGFVLPAQPQARATSGHPDPE